jgi:hypothetical protein
MPRRRSLLAVLALVLGALVLPGAAGPAWAGGPTSVLMVVPGEGRTASLYVNSPEYQQLADLLGAHDPATGGGTGDSHETGVGITLTWLIHDVQVWRVDRVYLDAEGGPWVSTQATFGDGTVWDAPVVWHAPDRGKELSTMLDSLLGPDASSSGGPATDGTSDTAASSLLADEAAPVAASEPAGTQVNWLVTGLALVLGLLGGAGLVTAASRLRRDDRHDQVLVDQLSTS